MTKKINYKIFVFMIITSFFILGKSYGARDAAKIRYRGISIPATSNMTINQADVDKWASWGINYVNIILKKDAGGEPFDGVDPRVYGHLAPYEENLAQIRTWCGYLENKGIHVKVALEAIWGWGTEDMWKNGGDNEYINHRIELCYQIAFELRNFNNVIAIGIMSEPHPYNDDAYKTYFLPRAYDRVRDMTLNGFMYVVAYAAADWGSPRGFDEWNGLTGTSPEGRNYWGVWYAFSAYAPHFFTHQGIRLWPKLTAGWPITHNGTLWNRTKIDSYLFHAKDFENRTSKRVFATFGCVRWAKKAHKYTADMMWSLNGQLDWGFHSLAGWNGFNPTYYPEDQGSSETMGPAQNETDQKQLEVVKFGWKLNK